MAIEAIFVRSGMLVLPFWLLMGLVPRWRWTERIIGSPLICLPAALVYLGLVVPQVGAIWSVVGNAQLGAVAALLGSPLGATIAWAHFLAFDLFVGRWAYLDSRARNVPALLMLPVLFLILMLGPIGFVCYLGLRVLVGTRVEQPVATATVSR